ncbi:MAG TPA: PAS domain S-box protein [Candidatus Kapabacteria bacterium]|nr:PAS domain S-box protein [Candidatus Kapabacteria bacterium]
MLNSFQTVLSISFSALVTVYYMHLLSERIDFSLMKLSIGFLLTYLLSFFVSKLIATTRQYQNEVQSRKKIEEDLLRTNEELKLYVERLEVEIQEKYNTERTLRKSEEQYRELVEKANIGIIIDDVDGNIKYFNEQLCVITGYSASEMITMNIKDIVYEKDLPIVLEKHQKRIMGNNPYERYEFRLKTKDKKILFVEADVSVIMQQQIVVGTKAYIWDITKRKLTELALKESEERFRSIYNNATMGFYRLSNDGRLIMGNPKFFEMLKISERELLNKRIEEVLEVDENRQNFLEILKKEKKINGYESEWYRKDGALFFGRETAWTITDEKGDIQYIDVILEDVTLKKQVEEEREQLISLLQSAKSEIKVLSGLLPICASCKRIRDENGNWSNIEQYIDEHSEAKFSHGICPDCAKKLYPSAYK